MPAGRHGGEMGGEGAGKMDGSMWEWPQTSTLPKSAAVPKLVPPGGERYSLLERAGKINQPPKNKWLKMKQKRGLTLSFCDRWCLWPFTHGVIYPPSPLASHLPSNQPYCFLLFHRCLPPPATAHFKSWGNE